MASFRPRSLGDFGSILWRRKWLLFLVTAAMLKATFTVASSVPNLYESYAKIAVITKPGDDSNSLQSQISAMQQRALSREMLSPVIARWQLSNPKEDIEQTVARLNKDIKVDTKMRDSYPPFPETITITYRHTDAKKAQAVVSSILSHFTQTNQALLQQAAAEVQQVEQELQNIEGPLGQISNRRMRAQMPVQPGTVTNQPVFEDPRILRRTLVSEINGLNDRAYTLERQITLQVKQINEQRIYAQSSPNVITPSTSTASYGVLLAEKAKLQAQVQKYQTQYTAENPRLIDAQTQLGEIERQLQQLQTQSSTGNNNDSAAGTQEGRELRNLERELDRLRTEREVTLRNLEIKKQELAQVPEALPMQPNTVQPQQPMGTSPTTDAEYERLSKRYLWLLDRREALQKAQTDNIHIGPNLNLFRLIDTPLAPIKPVAPNRMILKLLALGIALGIGFLTVACVEAREFFRIKDAQDVAFYLGAPVVGLIPETLTPVESSHARRQQWARVAMVVVAVIAAIPVLVLVLQQIGLFEVIGSK